MFTHLPPYPSTYHFIYPASETPHGEVHTSLCSSILVEDKVHVYTVQHTPHLVCVCGGGGCQRLHTQLYIYVYIYKCSTPYVTMTI